MPIHKNVLQYSIAILVLQYSIAILVLQYYNALYSVNGPLTQNKQKLWDNNQKKRGEKPTLRNFSLFCTHVCLSVAVLRLPPFVKNK